MARLILALLIVLLPSQAFAAWTATEGFEDYADGDLTGENGGTGWSGAWSGDVLYDVQGTVVDVGSKAVSMTAEATEPLITRSLTTAMTDGSVHISMRRNAATAGQIAFFLTSGAITNANRAFFFQLNIASNVLLEATDVGDFSANTWYDYDIEFDCTTDRVRVSIDGAAPSSWVNFFAARSTLDGMKFEYGAIGGISTQYFDDIRATAAAAAPSPQQGRDYINNGRRVINNGKVIISL